MFVLRLQLYRAGTREGGWEISYGHFTCGSTWHFKTVTGTHMPKTLLWTRGRSRAAGGLAKIKVICYTVYLRFQRKRLVWAWKPNTKSELSIYKVSSSKTVMNLTVGLLVTTYPTLGRGHYKMKAGVRPSVCLSVCPRTLSVLKMSHIYCVSINRPGNLDLWHFDITLLSLHYKINLWYAKYKNVLQRNTSFI